MFGFLFGTPKSQKFELALRESLPDGFVLPEEIWSLIQWLESKKQTFQYRSSPKMFLPTMPVKSMDHLWSHLAFVIEPDMVRYWFGKTGLEKVLVPLVKCGADGSHFAIWRHGEGLEFVFLGSEGEAFKVTSSVKDFITLITMGYFSIEGRDSLSFLPSDEYAEIRGGQWPNPVEIKAHIRSTLGVTYPATGESLIANDKDDPFAKFVEDTLTSI